MKHRLVRFVLGFVAWAGAYTVVSHFVFAWSPLAGAIFMVANAIAMFRVGWLAGGWLVR